MMRLDKYLAERTGMTRSESRKAVTKGRVSIDGAVCRKADTQLDEHTAALDPKTALKVLTLSAKIVEENHLTTMMITHNMSSALATGDRTIMMDSGRIIIDLDKEQKAHMTVSDLLALYREKETKEFDTDRILLQKEEPTQ